MGCNVFANGNEIACKKGGNKVIADMPDVCLSPPSPPAGPVPVPYPNTSFSKDMKNGSKTVKIKNGEVMLKDKSFYKTSPLGNEAATRSFGANVVTHQITGKTYCLSWSMDVKFEGKNVPRHLDLTSSNHASKISTVAPLMTAAEMATEKESKGIMKTNKRPNCGDGPHDWQCDKSSCPDCWLPVPCPDNSEADNKEYQESQAGTEREKIARAHAINKAADDKEKVRQAAAGEPVVGDKGAQFESQAISKARGERIEHISYKAHCKECHYVQEIDMVTNNSVKEAKNSASGFKTAQMKRVQEVRDQCFPNKALVMLTKGEDEEAKVKRTLTESPWKEWVASMPPKKRPLTEDP